MKNEPTAFDFHGVAYIAAQQKLCCVIRCSRRKLRLAYPVVWGVSQGFLLPVPDL